MNNREDHLPGLRQLSEHIAHVNGLTRDKAKRVINEVINWMGISLVQNYGLQLQRFGRFYVKRIIKYNYGTYAVIGFKPSARIALLVGSTMDRVPDFIEVIDKIDPDKCVGMFKDKHKEEELYEDDYDDEDNESEDQNDRV